MALTSRFPHPLALTDFDYILPDEKIARYPLDRREQSKLLVCRSGVLEDSRYDQLNVVLPSPSLIVFNNSRVIEARIRFEKPSGGGVEIFCLQPDSSYSTVADAMQQTGTVLWACLIGGASKWKRGQVLYKENGTVRLEARFIRKATHDFWVEFSWTPENLPFAAVLHALGSIPLPPYLKRLAEPSDTERYQTVYAAAPGSVAAPTAGLHFSEALLEDLSAQGIHPMYLTLHVGAGTFLPVKHDLISDHIMHEEYMEITAPAVEKLIESLHQPVIAVGTTSLRTLESLYWLGLQISRNENLPLEDLHLDQHYAYSANPDLSAQQALEHILNRIRKDPRQKLVAKTRLFIVPGYSFKIVRGLITNFHQPKSTLLMLVAALVGPAWKSAYAYALANDYRFLSYGDGCLFLP